MVCAVRYEPVSTRISLIVAVLQGFFAKYGLLHKTARKLRSHFKSLCANSLEKLAGNFFDLAGKQQGMILRKQGICEFVLA